jgi:hypothetical protein
VSTQATIFADADADANPGGTHRDKAPVAAAVVRVVTQAASRGSVQPSAVPAVGEDEDIGEALGGGTTPSGYADDTAPGEADDAHSAPRNADHEPSATPATPPAPPAALTITGGTPFVFADRAGPVPWYSQYSHHYRHDSVPPAVARGGQRTARASAAQRERANRTRRDA